MAPSWPLTGRSEELRFVDGALRRTDGPRGVTLAGAPGVGKTRLASEAVAAAQRRGATLRWISATESARSMPLGAFAGMFGSVSGDPAQVVRQVADHLLAGPGRGPVVVAVDDAHLLDDVSATLVHHLVLRTAATVVVTVRTGEPAPDAVTALWKDGHLARLEVQPLSEPETAALLEATLAGQVDQATARRLWTLSEGNALYLRHLVDDAIERGALHDLGAVWRLSGAAEVSPGLAELVAARMGGLSEPVRDVVDHLSLAEPLDVSLLRELTAPAAIEQAEEAGVVRVERDGRALGARLAHPLYGEMRRSGIGHLRARRLRGRIAQALVAKASDTVEDFLRPAMLAVESDLEPDVDLLCAAGERAAQLVDFCLAERLGRAALAAGGGFRAQRIIAFAAIWVGSPAQADTELAGLAGLASSDAEVTHASLARATNLAWVATRPEEAETVLDAAIARVRDPADRQPLIALRAMIDAQRQRPVRAVEVAKSVLAADRPADVSVLFASCALAAGLATTGRLDDLGPAVDRGLRAADGAAEFGNFGITLFAFQVTGLVWAGSIAEACARAAACQEQVKDQTLGAQIGSYLMGEAELASGRLNSARWWLRDALAGLQPFGDAGGWRYAALIALTKAEAVAGDVGAAHQTLADLHANEHPTLAFLKPEMILARAWVAAAEGAISQAITHAHEAATMADTHGQSANVVVALHTASRFGDRTVAGRLAQLVTHVHGPRAAAAAAHASALAADDGDALLEAADRLEQMGDLLAAADTAAQAARVYADQRLRGSSANAAARAHRLAESCDSARTPALLGAARPLPLTDREREIVTLAARGLSNREIAARLVVSVRTVEGHLYRAGNKLGVSDRGELAALLHHD